MNLPDIDIDFADRRTAMAVMPVVSAMLLRDGRPQAHPSGVYLQDVPVNPFTDLASLDYKTMEDRGFFKIDFLNQSVYADVKDEDDLDALLAMEPAWELLEEIGMVEQLPHIYDHFDIVEAIRPRSIVDLSVVLALMRPGKKHLVGRPRAEIDAEIWIKGDDDKFSFKRSHAISYATLIVVRMNMLVRQMLSEA